MSAPVPSRYERLVLGTAIAIVLAVHVWFVTYGTGVFLIDEIRGRAYDSLGAHLLQGSAAVDEPTIEWEGVKRDGRTHMYFGPLPALLRIPLNAVAGSQAGHWSRLSCLAASLLALGAVFWGSRRALDRAGTAGAVTPGARVVLLAAVVVGFGLGSPLLYLDSCARIYHEGVLWGLAPGLWGVVFSMEWIERRRSGDARLVGPLAGLSVAAGAALLGRLTFGGPLYLVLVPLALATLLAAPSGRRGRALGLVTLALVPALLSGLLQLWYDADRFGSPWKTMDWTGFYVQPADIGGVTNLRRIPDALASYLGLSSRFFVGSFPWVRLATADYRLPKLFFDWKEQTLSLALASPWLLLGSALGAASLRLRRSAWDLLVVAALALQALLILSWWFVTQRFAAELLPLLVFLLLVFFARGTGRSPTPRIAIAALLSLVLASAGVTLASTFHWNVILNGDSSDDLHDRFRAIFFPRFSPPWPGPRIPLSRLTWLAESHEFEPPRAGLTFDAQSIVLDGLPYPDGIGMHAVSRVTYPVPKNAVSFEALVGMSYKQAGCAVSSAVFEVKGADGRTLAASDVRRPLMRPLLMRVPVAGLSSIELVVGDAGDGRDCDHANWAMAAFRTDPAAAR